MFWFHVTTLSLPYVSANIVPKATRTARTVPGCMLPAAESMSEGSQFKAAPSRYRSMHAMPACSRNGEHSQKCQHQTEVGHNRRYRTHMQDTVRNVRTHTDPIHMLYNREFKHVCGFCRTCAVPSAILVAAAAKLASHASFLCSCRLGLSFK